MRKLRHALCAALLCAAFSATAAAQTTITVQGVTRKIHSGQLLTSQINLADCLADDRVQLTLGFGSGFQNYDLEVWAGVACDTQASRVGATATCWRIYVGQPNSNVYTAEFSVRDFLSGRTRAADPGDANGAAGASCEPTSAAILPQSLTAYVLLLDGNSAVGGSARWTAEYRLVGSPPPDRLFAGVGDGEAPIAFEYDHADTVAAGVQFYCDPPPNDPDAIARGALVASDAGAVESFCSQSDVLFPGTPAASLEHLRCGSAPAADLRGIAQGLVNGVAYNVAAATVDTFGNVGALSLPVCAVPQAKPAVHTKVQACSSAGTSPMHSGSALAFVVLLGSALTRRHRRG